MYIYTHYTQSLKSPRELAARPAAPRTSAVAVVSAAGPRPARPRAFACHSSYYWITLYIYIYIYTHVITIYNS